MRPLTLHAIVIAAVIAVQPAAGQHHPAPEPDASEIRMPEGKDSITLPLRTSGNHVLLPVSVNGSEPLPLILDTGMPIPGILLFHSDRLESLSLEYVPGRAQVGGAGGDGKRLEGRVASGVRLALGGLGIDPVRAIVFPAIEHFSLPHAGVIGTTILRSFTVRIDYDAGQVVLARPGTLAPPEGATEVPLELVGNLPYVKAGVILADGKEVPVNLVLDLGATHPVSLNAGSSDLIGAPQEALSTRVGRGVSGEVRGRVGRIAGFTLGGHRLDGVIATFPDPEHENPRGMDSRNGNLGMGILRHFNLTLDYAAGKLHVEPNRSFSEPFEWDMSGITTDPAAEQSLKVAEIVPGSPAAEAGLKEGDLLIAVDGEPLSSSDGVLLRERFLRGGADVSLSFVREGKTQTAEIKLRRLI